MDKKNGMTLRQHGDIKFSSNGRREEGGRGGAPAVISKSSRVTNKLQFDINKTPLYYT